MRINRIEIVSALERLGQLALESGDSIQLVVVGGAAMVLGWNARPATHDVDVVVVTPVDASKVRQWSQIVSREFGWSPD